MKSDPVPEARALLRAVRAAESSGGRRSRGPRWALREGDPRVVDGWDGSEWIPLAPEPFFNATDAALIAAVPRLLRHLCAEVASLRREVARLSKALATTGRCPTHLRPSGQCQGCP